MRLRDKALPTRLHGLAEAGLAREFGGSGDESVSNLYGLLAGCAKYDGSAKGGLQGRYVLVRQGSVGGSPQSRAYLKHVETLMHAILDKYAEQGTRVLDPWNGSGTTTSVCAARGYRSVGVDINPGTIPVAWSRQLILESHYGLLLDVPGHKKTRRHREMGGFSDTKSLCALISWCPEPESNRHAAKRQILSLLCLPVPPSGQHYSVMHKPRIIE